MEQLGRRLQRVRLVNGWSKRGVAQRLGVSIPSIIRWEEGVAEPNDYNRYKIERLLEEGTATALPPIPPRSDEFELALFPNEGRKGGDR